MPNYTDFKPYEPFLIETRRSLHMHPECGFDVVQTHDFVFARLREMGIRTIAHVGKNSLLGILENGAGPIVGLRADMDALPLTEANPDLTYRSRVPGPGPDDPGGYGRPAHRGGHRPALRFDPSRPDARLRP